jgi:hypothetical protein
MAPIPSPTGHLPGLALGALHLQVELGGPTTLVTAAGQLRQISTIAAGGCTAAFAG